MIKYISFLCLFALTPLAASASDTTWTTKVLEDPMDGSKTCIARRSTLDGVNLSFAISSKDQLPMAAISGDWILDLEILGGEFFTNVRYRIGEKEVVAVKARTSQSMKVAIVPGLYEALKDVTPGTEVLIEMDLYRRGAKVLKWTIFDMGEVTRHLNTCKEDK